ncbi:hypothetical protein [Paraburkholderia phytofirmans]|uniref:Uncharacterized protein n=1 Tax=Paraburkholderia phytofirmans TaxID=261302 RepID=A0ABW9BFI0_9BURK
MKIIVIGGGGLAGSQVMTVLRRDGHEVAAAPSQGESMPSTAMLIKQPLVLPD